MGPPQDQAHLDLARQDLLVEEPSIAQTLPVILRQTTEVLNGLRADGLFTVGDARVRKRPSIWQEDLLSLTWIYLGPMAASTTISISRFQVLLATIATLVVLAVVQSSTLSRIMETALRRLHSIQTQAVVTRVVSKQ